MVLGVPRFFTTRIAKSTVQVEQRLAVLPDGNCRTQLTESVKVLFEERRDRISQLAGA